MNIGNTVIAALGTALLLGAAVSCQDNVKSQDQTQGVREDGTAVQQRTRTREAASGAVVEETETRERKVVQPAPGSTAPADATKTDPGK